VPTGAAALWLQLQEVPYAPRGDAAGELDTTHGWTEALADGYANRVLDRIARHAPDLRDKIRAIDVLTPDDLRARNPNAVSGDPYVARSATAKHQRRPPGRSVQSRNRPQSENQHEDYPVQPGEDGRGSRTTVLFNRDLFNRGRKRETLMNNGKENASAVTEAIANGHAEELWEGVRKVAKARDFTEEKRRNSPTKSR
jgi:hypothetical protein